MPQILSLLLLATLILPSAAGAQTSSRPAAEFLFVGANGLDGRPTAELSVCAHSAEGMSIPDKRFKSWFNRLDPVAMQKTFDAKQCELLGIHIVDNPASKYRNVDSLEGIADGKSVYALDGDRLRLVKSFASATFYVVTTFDPTVATPSLKDLIVCGPPPLIDRLKVKFKTAKYCHDLKDKLYALQKAADYPSPLETNAVILSPEEFEPLKKKGRFDGNAVFKLVGEKLEPLH